MQVYLLLTSDVINPDNQEILYKNNDIIRVDSMHSLGLLGIDYVNASVCSNLFSAELLQKMRSVKP